MCLFVSRCRMDQYGSPKAIQCLSTTLFSARKSRELSYDSAWRDKPNPTSLRFFKSSSFLWQNGISGFLCQFHGFGQNNLSRISSKTFFCCQFHGFGQGLWRIYSDMLYAIPLLMPRASVSMNIGCCGWRNKNVIRFISFYNSSSFEHYIWP